MRILVTGVSGFVGSNLAPKLVEEGHDVYGLERYVTGRFVLGNHRSIKTVFGDLRDDFAMRKIVREIQPEAVVHLAAISPVSYSYDHPVEVTETNYLGTINLAEACLKEAHHFKHFLFAGTSEEYGNQEKPPMKECYELRPNSPYAVSKVAADKYLQYLKDSYDFPVTVLRNFNTYGRKENAHFVVERTIVQMLQGGTVRLGDPEPVRDLMYVEDHLNAYLTCLENEKAIGETFNFCTGYGIRIADLVDRIRYITGFDGEVLWNSIPRRPLDISVLIGDNSKAKRLLNWQPRIGLERGLKLTTDFLRRIIEKSQISLIKDLTI
jgi:nucleoside-diphosphate-sugar epimerase